MQLLVNRNGLLSLLIGWGIDDFCVITYQHSFMNLKQFSRLWIDFHRPNQTATCSVDIFVFTLKIVFYPLGRSLFFESSKPITLTVRAISCTCQTIIRSCYFPLFPFYMWGMWTITKFICCWIILNAYNPGAVLNPMFFWGYITWWVPPIYVRCVWLAPQGIGYKYQHEAEHNC